MHTARLEIDCSHQFDAFREVVRETYLGIDFDARSTPEDFKAEFRSRSIGALMATVARSEGRRGGLSAHRDRRRIVTETEDYMVFMMVRAGIVRHTQYGRTAVTSPGHMVLIDSREAYRVEVEKEPAVTLNIRLPAALLRGTLGSPERFCGLAIDGRLGLNAVLGDLLLCVWRRAPGLSADDASGSTTRVVEAVAALCSSLTERAKPGSSAGTLHFERAKRYVEARVADPALDPAHIAAALRVSTGHLHAVMRSNGTSAGKLILGMRLDRCRKALADPGQRHGTITRVALDWGFTDLPHFSRSFKARFGVTPRQYRSAALQPAAPAAGAHVQEPDSCTNQVPV